MNFMCYTFIFLFFISCFFIIRYKKLLDKKILDLEEKNKEIISYINIEIQENKSNSKEEIKKEISLIRSHIENGLLAISKRIGKNESNKN